MILLTKKFINHFTSDTLYRNSIYLMLNTGVMAIFGFFFWIINARLYTTFQIGIATSLISAMTLISNFSILGLNEGFIKYLPTSQKRNEIINSVFILVTCVAIFVSSIFILLSNWISPELSFLKSNSIYAFSFIAFMIIGTLNNITDTIFIAYRNTIFILIYNFFQSVVKIFTTFLFVGLASYGIFLAFNTGIITSLIFTIIFLYLFFSYTVSFKFDYKEIIKIIKFSFVAYISGIVGGLPMMLMPLIILNKIGPTVAAYFYIDMTIMNVIFIIPTSVTRSLFAEGAHDIKNIKEKSIRSAGFIIIILLPVLIITYFFGYFILSFFGKKYSSEGFLLLQILSLSSIFYSINAILSTILKLLNKLNFLILASLIGTVTTFSFCILLTHLTIVWIGVAWLLGNAFITVSLIIFMGSLSHDLW